MSPQLSVLIIVLVLCSSGPTVAREHISNHITTAEAGWLSQSYSLICSSWKEDGSNVRIFTEPNFESEYLGGIGNAPTSYIDMLVSSIIRVDDEQFLGGRATNASGYAVVRNVINEQGETIVMDHWYVRATDADCDLRKPGQYAPGVPLEDADIRD